MIKSAKKAEDGTYAIYNVYREEAPTENVSVQLYRDAGSYKKHMKSKDYAAFQKVTSFGVTNETSVQVKPLFAKEKTLALYTNCIGDAKVMGREVFQVKPGQESNFAKSLVAFANEAANKQAGLYASYVVQYVDASNTFALIQIFANASTYQYFQDQDLYKDWKASVASDLASDEKDMLRARVIENKGGLDYTRTLK